MRWNIELNDWDSPPPEEMLKVLDEKLIPGAIVLLHDGYTGECQSREATVELVEMIISKYMDDGYKFVTISELMEYVSPIKKYVKVIKGAVTRSND